MKVYFVCVWLQSRVYLGMPTLKDLILKRPSRQFQYLHVLLDLSSHEKEKVCFFFFVPVHFPPLIISFHFISGNLLQYRNYVCLLKVRSAALNIIKWMYEKDHLRDYIEKFALNYMQLLVHPNPPSLLFGVGEDTG